jgi:hypothetical protein
VIDAINNGTQLQLDVTVPPSITESSVWYGVSISLCITDGTLTCNTTRSFNFYNTNWCTALAASILANPSTPSSAVNVTWTSVLPSTLYTVDLYTGTTLVASQSVTYAVAGSQTMVFTGLSPTTPYTAKIRSTQGGYFIDCNVSGTIVTSALLPPP